LVGLTPVAPTRRQAVRVDVLGQIQAHSVWRIRPMALRELSSRGFSVESALPFDIGRVQPFRLGIDGGSSVVVRAMTRHCRLASSAQGLDIYLVGFEFFEVSEVSRPKLAALVSYARSLWDDTDSPAQ
jgi:hypothetical protein